MTIKEMIDEVRRLDALDTSDADEQLTNLAPALDGRSPETGRHEAYLCERRKRKEAEAQRDEALAKVERLTGDAMRERVYDALLGALGDQVLLADAADAIMHLLRDVVNACPGRPCP